MPAASLGRLFPTPLGFEIGFRFLEKTPVRIEEVVFITFAWFIEEAIVVSSSTSSTPFLAASLVLLVFFSREGRIPYLSLRAAFLSGFSFSFVPSSVQGFLSNFLSPPFFGVPVCSFPPFEPERKGLIKPCYYYNTL